VLARTPPLLLLDPIEDGGKVVLVVRVEPPRPGTGY
jgi:hypothetical protein